MASDIHIINLLIGYTKAGKSTLANFLNNIPMEISKNKLSSFTIKSSSNNYEIGNQAESCTKDSRLLGDFCDQPGLTSTSSSKDLRMFELFNIYKNLSSYPFIRLILLMSYEKVLNDNSSQFLIFLNSVVETYKIRADDLKGVHVIITKCPQDDTADILDIIEANMFGCDNILCKGLISKEVSYSYFFKPMLCNGVYEFLPENKREIREKIDLMPFLLSSNFELGYFEDILYQYALHEEVKNVDENSLRSKLATSKEIHKLKSLRVF